MAEALARKRPAAKAQIDRNLAALTADLLALDQHMAEIARSDPARPLLASHPFYQYLARRYGLNLKSLMWEPDDTIPEISSGADPVDATHAELIALAAAGDLAGLNTALEQALARDGLRDFVLHTFAPLTGTVGELWAGGRLQVFEEHLITRHLVRFLDVATSRLGRPPGSPRVLLATLPGERHTLGLLMVEALLWHSGHATLSLGTDIPMEQILAAVRRTKVQTVALSFSACYPRGPVRAHLEELADRLPQGVSVWIGGAGVRRLPRLPPSVERKSLDSL